MPEPSIWLPWLPSIVTVAGWAIVNWQANKRELRKEQRAVLDAAKKLVVETEAKAATYMCAADRNEDIEAEIKSALDQVEIELRRIEKYSQNVALVQAMASFADAATGADFESAVRSARTRSAPEVLKLKIARNTLLELLESLFSLRYSVQF